MLGALRVPTKEASVTTQSFGCFSFGSDNFRKHNLRVLVLNRFEVGIQRACVCKRLGRDSAFKNVQRR